MRRDDILGEGGAQGLVFLKPTAWKWIKWVKWMKRLMMKPRLKKGTFNQLKPSTFNTRGQADVFNLHLRVLFYLSEHAPDGSLDVGGRKLKKHQVSS